MKLVTAHKILIFAAVILGVVFALWAIWQWKQSGEASFGLTGGLSAVTAIALSFYLRRFVEKAAEWENTQNNPVPESEATDD